MVVGRGPVLFLLKRFGVVRCVAEDLVKGHGAGCHCEDAAGENDEALEAKSADDGFVGGGEVEA